MSVLPMQFDVDLYNKLAVQQTQAQKQQAVVLGKIAGIDEVMRSRLDVISSILEVQLKAIQGLLRQAENERDFSAAIKSYSRDIETIKQEQLESLRNLMAAREGVIEDGEYVSLTKEKKAEITEAFKVTIDALTQETTKYFPTRGSNLSALERKTQADLTTRLATYDTLMDSKTNMTNEYEGLIGTCRKIARLRAQMLNPPSKDLFTASQNGDLAAVKKFSLECWWDSSWVNQVDANGFSLLEIASFAGQLHVVKHLLKSGANTNFKDPFGYQAIHWAAKAGHSTIIAALIRERADSRKNVSIDARGAYDRTPLHMAVFNHQLECVTYLLQQGADLNAQTSDEDSKKTPLHDAVTHLNLPMVLLLCQQPNLNVTLKAGEYTALRIAVEEGHLEIAALLLGHSSWKKEHNEKDPNHITQLLTTRSKFNQTEMRALLSRFKK